MNWKFVFKLSLFGLALGLLTISIIPLKFEPVCWLAIFLCCAYLIPKNTSANYFLHGFLTCIFNCIWVTSAHIVFYKTYLANHPEMSSIVNNNAALPGKPQLIMLIMGPITGIISGLILGLFAVIAAKMQAPKGFPKDAAGTA